MKQVSWEPEFRSRFDVCEEELHGRYPRAVIVGHHDLNPSKDCPCIPNVAHEYADLQPK